MQGMVRCEGKEVDRVTSLGARIQNAEGLPVGRLDARLLGLACLIGSDLMFLNAFPPQIADPARPDPPVGSPFHVVEIVAFFAGALVCALAYLLVGHLARRRAALADTDAQNSLDAAGSPNLAPACAPLPWVPSLAIAFGLSVLGLAYLWMHGLVPTSSQSAVYACLCGAPLGAGNTLLHILWGRAYAALPPRRCLVHASASFAAGLTISILASMFAAAIRSDLPVLWIWTICQMLGCALLLWVLARPAAASEPARTGTDAPPTEQPVSDDSPSSDTPTPTRQVALYLWMAIGAQGVLSLLLGAYWRTNSLGVFYSPELELGVAWVVALVMLAIPLVGRRLPRRVGFGALYRVSIPVGTVILVADPFLSLMGVEEMYVTSGVSWTACLVVFGVVSWVATAQAGFAGRRISDLPFAVGRAAWALGLVAGVLVGSFADAFGTKMILTSAIIVFLVVLFVVQFVLGERLEAPAEPDTSEAAPDFQQWAAQTARSFGLSEREAAVFALLAQGRGETFIADALSISPNTVKTHRKHVYRKLGVSSREELLDLVAREAPGLR